MAGEHSRRGHSSKDSRNPELNVSSVGNYVLIRTLGEGNFAKVKLAKHKITGAEVAIKIIDKTKMDPKKISKMYREVRILKMLHHPNIIKLYEVIETNNTIFLVMEYVASGELYDYLVVHGKMKEKEARIKFRQILSAISYCHKKRVIHRDLKAENLLLDSNNNIKIADFGFSNNFDPYDKLDTFCGSPPYAAPELFQGRRYTGPEVDVWSLGVILYVMTTGCLPFNGKNLQEVREAVCRGKYRIPFFITDSCEKLIKKFLVRDPSKRASLDLFRDDPWINEGFTDSPIDVNLDETIEKDDEIIDMIVEKYNVDKKKLISNLDNIVYDDISAIYYLMYYDKQNKEATRSQKNSISEASSSSKTVTRPRRESYSVARKTDNEESENGTPGNLKPIEPARARRFTIDSAYNPIPFNPDTINNKPNPLDNNNNSPIDKILRSEITDNSKNDKSNNEKNNNDGIKKSSSSIITPAVVPSKIHVPVPPTSAKTPNGRRLRHNTISEAVPPISIKQFNDNKHNNTIKEHNENDENEPNSNAENDKNIEENYDPTKPRSVRFNMNTNTTSTKAPDEIIRSVIIACKSINIGHKMLGRFLIECTANEINNNPLEEKITFEVEVCKLPRLDNMYGLKFKRLSGPTYEYKDICEKLIKLIRL